jgi:hypothetical protein
MSRSRLVPVLLSALLLVGGLNVLSYAANGRPLLLGRSNVESRSATVHMGGRGPALRLETRAGSPPMGVSSMARVHRLNADRVDGFHGRQLGVQLRRYWLGGDGDESYVEKSFPRLPHGLYWASYEFHATHDGSLSCWLQTGTGVPVLAATGSTPNAVLAAEGLVHAGDGVVMRCRTSGIFDSGASSGSWIDFVRLTVGTAASAETISLDRGRSPGR